MPDAVLIRLRPTSPWRFGPGDGAGDNRQDRVDTLYRSDRLFSALALAARQLGWLDEWLEATARAANPAIAFTSLFPYQGDTLFATPPSTLWPPPSSLVNTPNPVFLSKIRWSAARFVPLSVIESMLIGQPILADQWIPDAESGCLLRRDRLSSSPFRATRRSSAAVDRLTRANAHSSSTACVEFEPAAGLWTIARYSSLAAHAAWDARVQAAFRLLADTGFGGRRTNGWGHAATPEFQQGSWPALLLPKLAQRNGKPPASGNGNSDDSLYWMLSLYSPASADVVDWTAGDYRFVMRGGHVENASPSRALKKSARMISEGSVLSSDAEPVGTAVNVAPDGFAHPVYRSGFAVALKLPSVGAAPEALEGPVETPADKEAWELEEKPCDQSPAEAIAPSEATAETVEPPEATPSEEEQPGHEL